MRKIQAFGYKINTLNNDVNHKNYNNWRYKQADSWRDYSDNELQAMIYHTRDIYGRLKGVTKCIGKLQVQGISTEIDRRLKERMNS